ncbi:MAG: MFS transporter, partial [Pseudomonadota bacterium]
MQDASQASETFCPAERRRYALLAAIVASAMAFIDGSVVSLAIPAMRQSLDASLTEAQWINNAYLLPLSALMLVGGASGDRFGLRRVFGYGILGFIAASILCAIAPTAETLIAARVLQGIAAAFMVPG